MSRSGGIKAGKAYVEASLDDSKLQRGLAMAQARMKAFGATIQSIGSTLVGLGAGITAPFLAAIKMSSDATESVNKFNAVFASQMDAAGQFAEKLATDIGRSKVEIRDAMSSFQAFFVGLGFGAAEARKMSEQMTALGLDFASFHNMSDPEAAQRFISALSGSGEVLSMFGVNIMAAALNQELLAMGLNKTTATASEQEKVLARLRIIMRSLGDQGAIGDAAKNMNTFAAQVKRVKGQLMDLGAMIGEQVMPAVMPLIEKFSFGLEVIKQWVNLNKELAGSIFTVVTTGLAIGAGMIAAGVAIKLVASTVGTLTTTINAARKATTFLMALGGPKAWAMIAAGIGVAVASTAVMASQMEDVTASIKAAEVEWDKAKQKTIEAEAEARKAVESTKQAAAALKASGGPEGAAGAWGEIHKRLEAMVTPAQKLAAELDKIRELERTLTGGVAVGSDLRQMFDGLRMDAINSVTGITDKMQDLTDEIRVLSGETTEAGLELEKMAEAGVPRELLAHMAELQRIRDEWKAENERQEQQKQANESMRDEAKSVREQHRTPEEKFKDKIARIEKLAKTADPESGKAFLDPEAAERARAFLRENALEELKRQTEEQKGKFGEVGKEVERGQQSVGAAERGSSAAASIIARSLNAARGEGKDDPAKADRAKQLALMQEQRQWLQRIESAVRDEQGLVLRFTVLAISAASWWLSSVPC